MKDAIRCYAALALVLGIASAALAADAPPTTAPAPAPRAMRMLKDLRDSTMALNFTDDQRKKLDDAFAEAQQKAEAFLDQLEKNRPSRQETMAAMRKLGDEVRAKIESILDESQKKTLGEKIAAIRQRFGAMRGGLAEVIKQRLGELNLTDEQKKKVETIIADTRQKLQQLRSAAGTDRQAILEKFQALREEVKAQLKQVLTPEQFEKVQGLLEPRPAAPPVEARK